MKARTGKAPGSLPRRRTNVGLPKVRSTLPSYSQYHLHFTIDGHEVSEVFDDVNKATSAFAKYSNDVKYSRVTLWTAELGAPSALLTGGDEVLPVVFKNAAFFYSLKGDFMKEEEYTALSERFEAYFQQRRANGRA